MNADAAQRDPPHGHRAPGGSPNRGFKKRVRHFTADDRAAHREFEKSRRKAFREQLTELATRIPALSNVDPQKLSKHTVVEETIARHEQLEASWVEALGLIRALAREREELLVEVNSWRAGAGLPPRERTASASTQSLASVEVNSRHYQGVAYGGIWTAEMNPGYQSLSDPGDQLGGGHYAQGMAAATDMIDTAGLPGGDLAPIWPSIDTQSIPIAVTSEAFPNAAPAQYLLDGPRGNGHFSE